MALDGFVVYFNFLILDFQYFFLMLPCWGHTAIHLGLHLVCVVLHRRLKMEEFIPTTFRMDVKEEREAFFAQQEGKKHQTSLLN